MITMEEIRRIVREEIGMLWGKPIPKKGERGYRPHIRNLENVHERLDDTIAELEIYQDFAEDVIDIINGYHDDSEHDKLVHLYDRYHELLDARYRLTMKRKSIR